MIVTGHQPNYLPYPGFFEKIARADLFVLVDNVQFVKRGPFGWIHRNRIKTGSKWDWLTVPVLTKGKFSQTIRETRINSRAPWARKHWRTIEWNYRKAPHFARYAGDLKAVYDREWEWLWELNLELIRLILRWLEIPTPVKIASDQGIEGKAGDLVLDICRKTGADAYLSGVHGRDYLDEASFREAGIRLDFQDFDPFTYPQTPPEPFLPNLASIDLVLNCGPDSRRLLLGERRGTA
ncbi:MAG: WbqC family protein [Planctomycetota bacterium]